MDIVVNTSQILIQLIKKTSDGILNNLAKDYSMKIGIEKALYCFLRI
jgi:hypothetical protein